jgi:hypothetical protein
MLLELISLKKYFTAPHSLALNNNKNFRATMHIFVSVTQQYDNYKIAAAESVRRNYY